MPQQLVPYCYHNYTDTLIAVGTAALLRALSESRENQITLRAEPAGFIIEYPDGALDGESNPFIQIRDKPSRQVSSALGPGQLWDKTIVDKESGYPDWWGTSSVINTLGSPPFNNQFYDLYTPGLGRAILAGKATLKQGGMSQLLYAQASKGVNSAGLSTSQGNLSADAEQMVAHLGYQQGAAGFIKDSYTLTVVPRPSSLGPITLEDYRSLVNYLRTFRPSAASGKALPPNDQTVPFFTAMMYFDFVEKLFDYLPGALAVGQKYSKRRVAARVIGGLDRMLYYKMGTSSAPFAADSLTMPNWLEESAKPVASNVRDVVRQTLGEHLDPNLLYLPVQAFSEGNPRLLVRFYRLYNPLDRSAKLHKHTIGYIMESTDHFDLNGLEMQRFAEAIRKRTYTRFYRRKYERTGEPPDFELLTKLKSASLEKGRLKNMLSEFVGQHNLRNARLHTTEASDRRPEWPSLSYEHLQVIFRLIDQHGPEFVANTLLAQAMSVDPKQTDDGTGTLPDKFISVDHPEVTA